MIYLTVIAASSFTSMDESTDNCTKDLKILRYTLAYVIPNKLVIDELEGIWQLDSVEFGPNTS